MLSAVTSRKVPLRLTVMIPSDHSNTLPAGNFLVDKVVVVVICGFCFVVVSVCSLPFSEVYDPRLFCGRMLDCKILE